MGRIVAQQFAVRYPDLVKPPVLVDTTSHGVVSDVTADNFLAAVDLSVIPEAGHFSMIEKPATFNRTLGKFIEEELGHA